MIQLRAQIHHVGIDEILSADFSRLVKTSQNFTISPVWPQTFCEMNSQLPRGRHHCARWAPGNNVSQGRALPMASYEVASISRAKMRLSPRFEHFRGKS